MDEMQSYLFRPGNCAYAYEFKGAHPTKGGYSFAVWAPNARAVSVVGDFNDWDHTRNPMVNHNGVWELEIPGVKQFASYKYDICGPHGNWFMKADPYAFHAETRPNTASKTYDINTYRWNDGEWMAQRPKFDPYHSPVTIYEVHLGSWKLDEQGRLYTYDRMADELVPYVKESIDKVHELHCYADLHCCGLVEPFVPFFIEEGFNSWGGQPLNDKPKLKRMYGDRMIFTHEMAVTDDSSEEEISAAAARFMEEFGYDNRGLNGTKSEKFRKKLYELSRKNFDRLVAEGKAIL